MRSNTIITVLALTSGSAMGYSFVPQLTSSEIHQFKPFPTTASSRPRSSSSSLSMVDSNVILGGGIAFAGLAAGIGLVAFTENQGERAKQRGGGLSDEMSTKMSGMFMEDVEVSSVSDLGSLTSKLEAALKETGSVEDKQIELTEEEKKKIKEEADDGW
eukprot:CAMPEP_0172497490 /NCGR_PEP_ID=MMETSP1066-20121228/100751_1 /TAXON_ID=671091 /ORGANISM="Coscinodiscus wailesii, Strain CCMP2513" /LENGTH=158 /DNA_ID=CAMNT_0013270303 /DNA_START=95 /DNA_END=571 /DNA_ORIENTATION=+